jgi:heat shock protein HslJ
MRFIVRSLAIMAVLVFLIPACSPRGATPAGTSWTLTQYGAENAPVTPLPGTTITLTFENGRIGGSAGCNSYGGDYSLRGEQFTVGETFRTLIACLDEGGDNSIMDQEDSYLAALHSAHRLTVSGDNLTIFYDGGVLRFSRRTVDN